MHHLADFAKHAKDHIKEHANDHAKDHHAKDHHAKDHHPKDHPKDGSDDHSSKGHSHFIDKLLHKEAPQAVPVNNVFFRSSQDIEAVLHRVVSLEDDGTSEVVSLPETSFLAFWTALSQLDCATEYLDAVLRRIDELEGQLTRSLPASSSGKPPGRVWTFGLMFKTAEKQEFPGSPKIKRSFQLPPPRPPSYEFKENVKAGLVNTILMLALYYRIHIYKIPAVYERARFSQPGTSWKQTALFVLYALIESHDDVLITVLSTFAAYISSSLAVHDNSMIACGWIYIWLMDQVLDGDERRIHRAVIHCLKLFVEDKTKIITPAHEFQVTLVPEDTLELLEEHVQHLTFWTHPVGYHASIALYNILQDKKAPGHALRKRSFLNDTRLSPGVASSPNIGTYYVLVNEDCPGSVLLASLLNCNRGVQLKPSWEGDLTKVRDLRTLLIYQMLQHSGADELVREATEQSVVSTLSPAAFTKLFEALVELHEEASEMESVNEAREHRRQRMVQLWREMVEAPMRKSRSPASRFHEFSTSSLDPLPLTILRTTFTSTPRPAAVGEELVDIRDALPLSYSESSSQGVLNHVLQSAKAGLHTVRVLVTGGDKSVHNLLLGYVKLVMAGNLAGGLAMPMRDVVFYVLPTGESNVLATFIAQRDLWYDANIYRPVKGRLPIVPHVRSSVPQATSNSSLSDTVPGFLLTRQLENYILEAECVLRVTVFNCEAWFKSESGKTYMCTIPFCTRAEIGISEAVTSPEQVSQEQHRQCIPRKAAEKVGNYGHMKVSITYQPVPWDRTSRTQSQEIVSLGALAAVNVPRASESRLDCNPRDQLLNICMLSKDTMKQNKVKTYDEFVRSCTTFRTKRLLVESMKASFDVTLDGEMYGPFDRIKLHPTVHPYDKQDVIKFMVATFWPTEIDRESS